MTADRVGTTRRLAEFVAAVDAGAVPDVVLALVKRQCLDVAGVALAGSIEPAAVGARRVAMALGGKGGAGFWGHGGGTSPAEAAFVNGIAAHALDFDDIWLPGAHPSAPIFPAAFAVAEAGHLSGLELLAAMIAGYEVMGRLHSAVPGRAGWHPTGVFGTFGAAAACARLLKLSAEETAMAFGVASSMTGGVDAHEGTMTKPFHAGHAARGGVVSALLASEGFTASPTVFDGGHSFFAAFYRDLPAQTWRVTAGLGERFHLVDPGIGIKVYPAGYHMHHTFEAALRIVCEHDLRLDDISRVLIGVRPGSRFDRVPRSALDAKFSLQYMAAMAIVRRELTIESFSEDTVRDPAVREALDRIETYPDPGLPDNPDIAYNQVTVCCLDGREFSCGVTEPRSHWRYPLPQEEWLAKFMRNAHRRLPTDAVTAIVEAFDRLEELADVSELGRLLGTPRPEGEPSDD